MSDWVLAVIGLTIAVAIGLLIRATMQQRKSLRALGSEAEKHRVTSHDTLRAGWFSGAHIGSDGGSDEGSDGGGGGD